MKKKIERWLDAKDIGVGTWYWDGQGESVTISKPLNMLEISELSEMGLWGIRASWNKLVLSFRFKSLAEWES
jgi:hypothetical protein